MKYNLNIQLRIRNKEQFTICFRWIDSNLQDHEDFIGLYEVDNISANCLLYHIKDVLLRMNLNLSKCRGQCYDGASNMSGIKNGVAAQISSEEKRAIYTHCYGHSLNLAVSDCIKKCKGYSNALDTAFEITKLVNFLPKKNLLSVTLGRNLKREWQEILSNKVDCTRKFCTKHSYQLQ